MMVALGPGKGTGHIMRCCEVSDDYVISGKHSIKANINPYINKKLECVVEPLNNSNFDTTFFCWISMTGWDGRYSENVLLKGYHKCSGNK